MSLPSGHMIGSGIEAQPKAASHRLKQYAGCCGTGCCPGESRDLVSWLVGPIRSSPLWAPGKRGTCQQAGRENVHVKILRGSGIAGEQE